MATTSNHDPGHPSRHHAPHQGLTITVVGAIGHGRTALSAFDDALWRCGVADYNLLPLSSVIPPASSVVRGGRYQAPAGAYGHRLYVVKAEMRAASPGTTIAAGVGWLQWGDARGVLVEHELACPERSPAEAETTLASQITDSLRDLAARRGVAMPAGPVAMRLAATRVASRPASALVLAVFAAESW